MPVLLFVSILHFASAGVLEEISGKVNKDLPEVYDHATKLMRTTVENGYFVYQFLVDANKEEFAAAVPKVRAQVMSTICRHSRERTILIQHRSSIVYRYENGKGQSLGEFMIPRDHCGGKKS